MIDYDDSDRIGNSAVDVFIDFLINKINIDKSDISYVDIENKDNYDIAVKNNYNIQSQPNITYEIKSQKSINSGLICIEESSIDGNDGWIYKTSADFLVIIGTTNIIIIPMKELKQFYNKNKGRYKLKTNGTTKGLYGEAWKSEFRMIPLMDLILNNIKIQENQIWTIS